jgi:hypothetical protein
MILIKVNGKIIGHTPVQDYVFRPTEFNNISLFDWIRLSKSQTYMICSILIFFPGYNLIVGYASVCGKYQLSEFDCINCFDMPKSVLCV